MVRRPRNAASATRTGGSRNKIHALLGQLGRTAAQAIRHEYGHKEAEIDRTQSD
jgi:hypothetical protein